MQCNTLNTQLYEFELCERMQSSVVVFCFLLYVNLDVSQAELCADISGRWINKLGSEVVIDHLQSGVLRGHYYTAVSSSRGKLRGHVILGMLVQLQTPCTARFLIVQCYKFSKKNLKNLGSFKHLLRIVTV